MENYRKTLKEWSSKPNLGSGVGYVWGRY